MRQNIEVTIRGKQKEWGFVFKGDPKYLEEWRADGLEVAVLLNRIPQWAQRLGLSALPAAASWEAPIELPALPEPEGIDGDCGQWGPGRVYAYTAGQMQAYARDYARAALAAAPAEPKTKDQTGGHSVAAPSLPSGAASEAVRSLQALRVVIGIDSPETRGWAPAVQQEARRAIDRALVVLAKQGPK